MADDLRSPGGSKPVQRKYKNQSTPEAAEYLSRPSVLVAQRVKTLGPNRIYMENASPFFALNRLCRVRRDGLYRTLSTLTTSNMAGRDWLPATPSDSGTHARRAHAYREQQNTPFMRLRHASGSTPQNLSSSSGHASKACMRSAQAPWLQRKPQTMHPPSFPRPLLLADARSALSARSTNQGTAATRARVSFPFPPILSILTKC